MLDQYESGAPTKRYVAAQLRRDIEARDHPQPWHGPDRDRDPWEPRAWETHPLRYVPPVIDDVEDQ